MGIIYLFESIGAAGGTWYAATYPLGATRYYTTAAVRSAAVERYADAIRGGGGHTITYDVTEGESCTAESQ